LCGHRFVASVGRIAVAAAAGAVPTRADLDTSPALARERQSISPKRLVPDPDGEDVRALVLLVQRRRLGSTVEDARAVRIAVLLAHDWG
jgi:hypothetical protein